MRNERRHVTGLDANDAETIRELLAAMCIEGQCYEFALAVHRGTGLPLIGLWSQTASGDDGVPGTWRHAAVRVPGGYFDARGFVAETDFANGYGEPRPWRIEVIGEDDLTGVRPVPEARIATVAKLAQAAWPELPWRPTTYLGRAASFLADLEQLSRLHRMWIRAPYPAGRPVLAEGDGDETGYSAGLTDDGLGVVFDRSFDALMRDDRPEEPGQGSPEPGFAKRM